MEQVSIKINESAKALSFILIVPFAVLLIK